MDIDSLDPRPTPEGLHDTCLRTLDRALELGNAFKDDADRYRTKLKAARSRIVELEARLCTITAAYERLGGS